MPFSSQRTHSTHLSKRQTPQPCNHTQSTAYNITHTYHIYTTQTEPCLKEKVSRMHQLGPLHVPRPPSSTFASVFHPPSAAPWARPIRKRFHMRETKRKTTLHHLLTSTLQRRDYSKLSMNAASSDSTDFIVHNMLTTKSLTHDLVLYSCRY